MRIPHPFHAVLAAAAVASSGCSAVLVQRPQDEIADPTVPDTCTRSVGAPVADTVIAGVSLASGIVGLELLAIASTECSFGSDCNVSGIRAFTIAAGAVALATAASSIYGYTTTSHCRRQVKLGDRCARGDLAACRSLKPGWDPASAPAGWGAPPPPPAGRSAPAWPPPPPPAQPPSAPGDGDPWGAAPAR
jgi:hypothetical protein